jgi:hypothetical protein
MLEGSRFGEIVGFGSLDREPFRLGSPRLLLVTAKGADGSTADGPGWREVGAKGGSIPHPSQ